MAHRMIMRANDEDDTFDLIEEEFPGFYAIFHKDLAGGNSAAGNQLSSWILSRTIESLAECSICTQAS